ncbi:hypothetical protein ACWF94_31615 [Streptomyces sp. NPDC055078]
MSMSPAAWLAQADPDPERAKRWLSSTRIVLLPIGRTWDAVKAPRIHGLAAVESGIDGPVISDPAGQTVFFLVPPGTSATWDLADTTCLGDACWLSVLVPAITAPPGPHWLQPPDGCGTLVTPDTLWAALTAAAELPPAGSER